MATPHHLEKRMEWFFGNPKIFNYVILTLYCLNAAWWGWHGKWADTSYWMSAFAITATVTWGYQH